MDSQTHSKGGRRSKYSPKFADQLIAYFEDYLKEPYTREVSEKLTTYYKDGETKSEIEKYKIIPKGLPTLFAFSRKIGVSDRTLLRWSEARIGARDEDSTAKDKRPFRYPAFCLAYKQAVKYQTEYLTLVGLGGLAPSAFAIFTAKNVIGWRDKNEMGFTDEAGKDLPASGFVLLPRRLTDEEAAKEYTDQQAEPVPA